MYILLAIVGLAASASAKDLIVGQDGGILKYEQNVTASPTIWRQERNITFNVSDSEVITKVDVKDCRDDKKGEAAIVEGGIGYKNVTIQLMGPAVFRGFDFEVRVFAKEESETKSPSNIDQQNAQSPFLQDTNVNDKQGPKHFNDEVDKVFQKPVPNGQDKVQHPIEIGQENTQQVRYNRGTQEQATEQKPLNPKQDKDLQAAKDINKPEEVQQQQTQQSKGFHPMINDNDRKEILDTIFTENKSSVGPTKPVEVSTKVPEDFGSSLMIDNNGPGVKNWTNGPKQEVSTSTTKGFDGQQTEKSVQKQEFDGLLQTKTNVPLPYINH